MVNEAVRTRQYREYLDADKHISRQIYNLYQRQESAYNEGVPSIRNQNQLAPISGVIEAVSAFQTELQTLLGNTTNSYFQRTAQNFIPTVKTFNALVFALRSIQKIYTKDVQIKYEVDKLLRPVIDLLQSLGAQLAFDPAVSNRLFQMRTNLMSKVYERVDFNVGRRTVLKSEADPSADKIQTLQPSGQEEDTFQAPVTYDPVSNDPFVGTETIKPEPPETLYGLATDGINLSENEKESLKKWVENVAFTSNSSPKEFWMDTVKIPQEQIISLDTSGKKKAVESVMSQFAQAYDDFPENIQFVLEKNQFGLQKIKDLYELLTKKLNALQISSKQQSEVRLKQMKKGNKAPPAAVRSVPSQVLQVEQGKPEKGAAVRSTRVLQSDEVLQPEFNEKLRGRQMAARNAAEQAQQQEQLPTYAEAARQKPSFSAQLLSPPSAARPSPATPISPSVEIDIPSMSASQFKALIQSKFGSGGYNKLQKDGTLRGNGYEPRLQSLKENFALDPVKTVRHLNERYQLNLTVPSGSTPSKKTGMLTSLVNVATKGATAAARGATAVASAAAKGARRVFVDDD